MFQESGAEGDAAALSCVDIDVGLTPSHCSYRLFNFLQRGEVDASTGKYYSATRTLPAHPSAAGRKFTVFDVPWANDIALIAHKTLSETIALLGSLPCILGGTWQLPVGAQGMPLPTPSADTAA